MGPSSDLVAPEGVMKATVQPGNGRHPGEGDQVTFHFTVRRKDGPVLFSTIKDHGGEGVPRRVVLGHSRIIPGLDHGLRSMQEGEVAMLKIAPEAHFWAEACQVAPPEGVERDEDLLVEVRVGAVREDVEVVGEKRKKKEKEKGKGKGKGKGKASFEGEGLEEDEEEEDLGPIGVDAAFVESDEKLLTKLVVSDGKGWEQPRAPFEVHLRLKASLSSSGAEYFSAGLGGQEEPPLQVTMGQGQLPPGLEKAVGSMRRGESARVWAWEDPLVHEEDVLLGDKPGPLNVPLPPAAGPVEYEVKLEHIVQVRDVLGNGQVFKKRLVDGEGEFPVDCPLEDCVVRVHYTGTLPEEGGRVFADTRQENGGAPLEVATGEGMLPEALETSIRVMLPGETALVTSSPAHAYDVFPRPENVPPGARVQWEVELISFQAAKRWDGLNFREIMIEVEKTKEMGNSLFKRELYQLARAKYDKMIRELKNVHPHNDEETKEWASVTTSLQLNVAACHHKLGDHKEAVEWANKVLESSPFHAKALFRRGQAHMMAGDYEEARADFKKMMSSDASTSRDAQGALSKLKKLEEEANQKQRQQFKGLFDKKPGGLAEVGGGASGGNSQAPAKMRRTLNDADGSFRSGQLMGRPGGAVSRQTEGEGEGEGLSEFKDSRAVGRKGRSWLSWLPSFVFCVIIATSSLSLFKGMGIGMGRQEL